MISRRSIAVLCAVLVAGGSISAWAIEYNERRLNARLDGDFVRISAPNFKFLNGASLDRLKDGASVAFYAQLTVSSSPNYLVPEARSVARFAISYDIWEERFSITKIGDRPDQKRTISHLQAAAAEAWCFDNMSVSRAEVPADKPFYLQLDLRVEDPRDQSGVVGDAGVSISRMVDIFSRPIRQKQIRYLLDSGPVRLEELRRGMRG